MYSACARARAKSHTFNRKRIISLPEVPNALYSVINERAFARVRALILRARAAGNSRVVARNARARTFADFSTRAVASEHW